jgi:hypothetical protein
MRTIPHAIRSFARQLTREFSKLYQRDRSKFRRRAAALLKKSIPGCRPGPKLITQTTDAAKRYEQEKLHCQEEKVPFDPRQAWKEIRAALHVPNSEAPRLRDRVRSRRYIERRRKNRRGIYT